MRAFLRKEWMEITRTGRLLVLGIIFFLFGVMNPGIAKLTPWLLETMKESMAESGMVVGEVTVNAMTSWTQFYKNGMMCLIVIVLMLSGVLVSEYQKGTLVQVVTKGLSRRKIVVSKMITAYGLWTAVYLVYFGVTFGYNAYFWPEEEIEHLALGATSYWLFGMYLLAFLLMFSCIANNSGQVLMGVGAVAAVLFFVNYVPKTRKYLPLRLTEGLSLSTGALKPEDFLPAIIITCVCIVVCGIISIVTFDKRNL